MEIVAGSPQTDNRRRLDRRPASQSSSAGCTPGAKRDNGQFVPSWNDPDLSFNDPADIAIHGERAYVVERGNQRVQSFTLDGVRLGQWGSYGTIGDGQFSSPRGIGVDSYGFVYVADTLNDRVQKFTSDGDYLAQFGESGMGNGQLSRPVRVDVAANGYVYVLDRDNNRVQVFEPVS